MENSMKIPEKTDNQTTIWFINPIPRNIPEEMKTLIWKDTRISIFLAALFTMTKIWKQPKYLSTDEWIKKIWVCVCVCTHKMGYNSHRKNEILLFSKMWMDLEGIIHSEISKNRKTNTVTTYM